MLARTPFRALRFALVCVIAANVCTGRADSSKRLELTVADSIATARVMGNEVIASPDGSRYAMMVIRGDLKRNGNWVEIISGTLGSLEEASRYTVAARLFTKSEGGGQSGNGSVYLTLFNQLQWLDNERVAFLWDDGSASNSKYILAVNVRTRRRERLTNKETDVASFAVDGRGSLVYTTESEPPRTRVEGLLQNGFVVTNQDVWGLLDGRVDGFGVGRLEKQLNRQTYLLTPRISREPRKVLGVADASFVSFSPLGERAIVRGTASEIPPSWSDYTDGMTILLLRQMRKNPARFQGSSVLPQLMVVDLKSGITHPLLRAPMASHVQITWAPNGRSVVVVPTFLPAELADPAGLAGSAMAEIDIESGELHQFPLAAKLDSSEVQSVRWSSADTVEVRYTNGQLAAFARIDGRWRTTGLRSQLQALNSAVTMELRQDLNTPPALFAVENGTRREELVLDLDPGLLSRFTLGRVEMVQWTDASARVWHGRLYYPVHHVHGKRFPLVIQTHDYAPPTEFSLYGFRYPGISFYAAQPLANKDIAVLQMEDKSIQGLHYTPGEQEMYMEAYEAAVDHFDKLGLIDRSRVGLAGYSRTGSHVEYALTHSSFPYAAALASDNLDGGYMQAALSGWGEEYSMYAGALPFGDGLKVWLERSPAFNAEKVHTPLRLQCESGGLPLILFNGWEMFSRLRYLRKPVELYVAPDIDHGTHAVQNPAQALALKTGAVDWFDFWLNEHEDPNPAKTDQYVRWHKLRELRDALPNTDGS